MSAVSTVVPLFKPGVKRLTMLLCACLILVGCSNLRKSPQAQREENARKDVANITQAEASKAGTKADRNKPAPKTASTVPVLSRPLTLDQAVAFALEHNLEALISAQEQKVQAEMATGAMYRLLPMLLVEGDSSNKSWDVPSRSVSAYTHQESLEPSISTERLSRTANVTLSWDLLNLSVNMVRWRQAKDRVHIAGERLRRLKQDIVLSVTRAYLKAQVAKDAVQKATALLGDIDKRMVIINGQIESGLLSRLDGLQNRANLTEMALRLKTYSSEYRTAMAELAEMLGVKDVDGLSVADIDLGTPLGMPEIPLASLENEALRQRPELYQQDLEQNVSLDEANAALMQMFPAITPYGKYSADSNKYLSRNDWYIVGVRLSWDLFSLPKTMYDRYTAQSQAQLAAKRRMRLTLAVTTQIKLSIIECQETLGRLQLSKQLEAERREVLDMVRDQVRQGKLKESLLLDEDQRYMSARLRHLGNYAGFLAARARLINSLGRDWNAPSTLVASASAPKSGETVRKGRSQASPEKALAKPASKAEAAGKSRPAKEARSEQPRQARPQQTAALEQTSTAQTDQARSTSAQAAQGPQTKPTAQAQAEPAQLGQADPASRATGQVAPPASPKVQKATAQGAPRESVTLSPLHDNQPDILTEAEERQARREELRLASKTRHGKS
ncbi:hypothetical protein JCM15519_30540 [Fundidesulfovibrio butyratiphilus]